MSEGKNKLVTIGVMGDRTAYLNVPREEAIKMYMEENGIAEEDFWYEVNEFQFDKTFVVYDAVAGNKYR